jgi:hypothetical protein
VKHNNSPNAGKRTMHTTTTFKFMSNANTFGGLSGPERNGQGGNATSTGTAAA